VCIIIYVVKPEDDLTGGSASPRMKLTSVRLSFRYFDDEHASQAIATLPAPCVCRCGLPPIMRLAGASESYIYGRNRFHTAYSFIVIPANGAAITGAHLHRTELRT
jgi:hypothetical protein